MLMTSYCTDQSLPRMMLLLQSDVAKVVDWLYSAGLSLNAGKSNVIIFSRKFSRPVIHIMIHNTVLPIVDSIRFLGVDLKWNTHVVNNYLKARQQLGIVHRMQFSLGPTHKLLG